MEKSFLPFLSNLIKIPSLSGHEDKVAKILETEMKNLDFDEVFVDDMGNVIGRITNGKGPKICYNGHMDHVPVGELKNWKYDPFSAKIVDGVMYGRATVDMKSALAAMVYGVKRASDDGHIKGTVYVVGVVHEELQEGVAMRYIVEEDGLSFDAVVLGEATNLNLAIGHRGRVEAEIIVYGKTSHASMPEFGDNAIYHAIPILQEIIESQKTLPEHKDLGKGTIAVTSIRAYPGEGPVVPDKCRIVIDRRTAKFITREDFLNELDGIIERAKMKDKRILSEYHILKTKVNCYTGLELEAERFFPTWLMERTHPVVQAGKLAIKNTLGKDPMVITWRFSTDGVYTNGIKKIPTIGFGPGDESLAHQPNEHIRVNDVITAIDGYANLAKELTRISF